MSSSYEIDNYKIFFDIDTDNKKYNGIVGITLLVHNPTNIFKIHSKNLIIKSTSINNNKIQNWDYDIPNEIIILKHNFTKQKHTIMIEFENNIGTEPNGFYYCVKNGEIVFCSNLEPESAREFFPCVDVPNVKSIFNISVRINANLNAVSNASIKNVLMEQGLNKNVNKKIVEFNPSPKMSSYLVCLVLGNLIKIKGNLQKIKTSGYCIKHDKKYISWSIDKVKNALDFYTKWFGIDYPSDKLDIISVPNFSSGAMENWGAITFREECILLYDKTDYLAKLKILEVIYHEIAHQWFGNLVTLTSWDDLWLNEATATYFSWMALEHDYSNWNTNELYWILEYSNILLADAISHTHPIKMNSSVNTNINMYEPEELFDEITYTKGCCIIRYIVNLLGKENFQKSMAKYISSNLYSNTTANDLYNCFNEFGSAQINYAELISNIVGTTGFPIIWIDKKHDKYYLSVNTFNLDKNVYKPYNHEFWLEIKYFNNAEWKNTIIKINPNVKTLLSSEITLEKFIINPNNYLFCICSYINFLPNFADMNSIELMKYIHDEFILGLYGYIDIRYYLELVNLLFCIKDFAKNYLVLYVILNDLNKLIGICPDNLRLKKYLSEYKIDIKLSNIFEKLFNANPKPKYVNLTLEQIIIILANVFESIYFINLSKKLYDYQITKLLSKKNKYVCNHVYLSGAIFGVVMKWYQDECIMDIIKIIKYCENSLVVLSAIKCLSMLNKKNFTIIFKKYKNIIKSQDYQIFFGSISKITCVQSFIINYWICNHTEISPNSSTQYKILKTISKCIYDSQNIKVILSWISKQKNSNKLIFGQIKDILQTNKIVAKSVNNLSQ